MSRVYKRSCLCNILWVKFHIESSLMMFDDRRRTAILSPCDERNWFALLLSSFTSLTLCSGHFMPQNPCCVALLYQAADASDLTTVTSTSDSKTIFSDAGWLFPVEAFAARAKEQRQTIGAWASPEAAAQASRVVGECERARNGEAYPCGGRIKVLRPALRAEARAEMQKRVRRKVSDRLAGWP